MAGKAGRGLDGAGAMSCGGRWREGRFGGFRGFGFGRRRVAGQGEAEGFGEGAQEAGGAGDLGQQGHAVGGGQERVQLAGAAAGVVVVNPAQEPGLAGGQAGHGGPAAGGGDAMALLGQGVVAPVVHQGLEALDGAVEIGVDAKVERHARRVAGCDLADDGHEAGEDGPERGGERCHCC